jgi:hypothetical protein
MSVLNCESLKIRPSDDFRVYIPPAFAQRPYKLQWVFELAGGNNLDIGFAVLEQLDDGSLPTLIPYRRVKKGTAGEIIVSGRDCTIVVLFDNSYSWARAKELKCSVLVSLCTTAAVDATPPRDESSSPVRRLDFPTPSVLPVSELAQLVREVVRL